MAQKKPACVITMVKDDHFFLDRWVRCYGAVFGRDALYVVNRGKRSQRRSDCRRRPRFGRSSGG